MRSSSRIWSALLLGCVVVSPAFAQAKFDAAATLPQIIECKLSQDGYLGTHFPSEAEMKKLKWVQITSTGGLTLDYQLPKPITVFGYQTAHIQFTSGGMLAVLDEPDAKKLATTLKVPKVLADSAEFYHGYDKLAFPEPTLNSLGRHVYATAKMPGKTIVGCYYVI